MAEILSGRVEIEEGVVYGRGGGRDLLCDVFTPPGGKPSGVPSVLLVHGGGWREGDRTQLRGYGVLLGRLGFVCVACEYRLLPESPWPAQVQDVKAAVRWMRANHERLGIDPEKIAISGNSAGGHLSLLVAGTQGVAEFEGDGGNAGVSTAVSACIAFYPVTDIVHLQAVAFLFGDHGTAEAARQASPATHVSTTFPPTLIIHGNKDEVVPTEQSTLMYDALQQAGVPTELHIFAEQPHGFDAEPRFGRQCADLMRLFLERYVRERAAAGVA